MVSIEVFLKHRFEVIKVNKKKIKIQKGGEILQLIMIELFVL